MRETVYGENVLQRMIMMLLVSQQTLVNSNVNSARIQFATFDNAML